MPSGTVKWFDPRRGYGFIQPDDGSQDVFVHISAVEQSELGQVVEGQKIQFDLEDGRQGKPAAANLRRRLTGGIGCRVRAATSRPEIRK